MSRKTRIALFVAVLAIAVLFPSSCGALFLPKDIDPFPEYASLSFFLHSLKDIDHFNTILQTRFQYQQDDGDLWKTPEQFYFDGGGDCEDYAFFVAYVFLKKGWAYRAYVVIAHTKRLTMHAIAVMETSRCWYVYDVWIPFIFEKDGTGLSDIVRRLGYTPIRTYQVVVATNEKRKEKKSGCAGGFCPLE